MALSRKDFIRRAKLIQSFRSEHIRRKLTDESIKEFRRSNPRFDESRFREFIKKKK